MVTFLSVRLARSINCRYCMGSGVLPVETVGIRGVRAASFGRRLCPFCFGVRVLGCSLLYRHIFLFPAHRGSSSLSCWCMLTLSLCMML